MYVYTTPKLRFFYETWCIIKLFLLTKIYMKAIYEKPMGNSLFSSFPLFYMCYLEMGVKNCGEVVKENNSFLPIVDVHNTIAKDGLGGIKMSWLYKCFHVQGFCLHQETCVLCCSQMQNILLCLLMWDLDVKSDILKRIITFLT